MANSDYNPQPFVSNPMSSFDPTQWANPYSLYSKQALPWPSQYAGAPTDAYGNPIQSFQTAQTAHDAWNAANPTPAATPAAAGTTLNTNPLAGFSSSLKGGEQGTQAQQLASQNAFALAGLMHPGANAPYSGAGSTFGANNTGQSADAMQGLLNAQQLYSQSGAANPTAPAAAARAAPTNPIDMSQAYLQALANPGPLKPVGANVPESAASTQPSSGVLQNFLANWQPQGGSGPGAGFTQAFSKSLRGR